MQKRLLFTGLIILFMIMPVWCQNQAKGIEGEKLAGISIDDTQSAVLKLLGEPEVKSQPEIYGFDGLSHQSFFYKKKGIEIEFAGKKAWVISITSPNLKGTVRGVKIGDPESKVRKCYLITDSLGRAVKKIRENDPVYCGSVYNGLQFVFDRKGNLKRISLGAFSE